MSKTDKDRPWWVQKRDPLNQRFRRVTEVAHDWWWKKMWAAHGCWCCSQKQYYQWEQSAARAAWKIEQRKLLKGEWDE